MLDKEVQDIEKFLLSSDATFYLALLSKENDIKDAKFSSIFRKKGNELFGKKDLCYLEYLKVLFYFNGSIAYAPDKSDELINAYSNRSLLLLHLKKYDLSLIDIDRVLGMTQSTALQKS